jgi:hypothetical protein
LFSTKRPSSQVELVAYGTLELEAEVQVLVAQVTAETVGQVGKRVAGNDPGISTGEHVGRVTLGVDEQGVTVSGVYTSILGEEEGANGFSFTYQGAAFRDVISFSVAVVVHEAQYFVIERSTVHVEGPLEVRTIDQVKVQQEFEALVADFTGINRQCGDTVGLRLGHVEQQVGARLDVVANATAKETVGGFEVNGGVNRAGSFPGQLGVFQLRQQTARI